MESIRVHKTGEYTIMSNNHFRNKEMSLKAKGLLSLMLSLPEDWDYSIRGLCSLSKDGKDSVIAALDELKHFGYLEMQTHRDDKGRYVTEYDVYESPERVYRFGKPESVNPNRANISYGSNLDNNIILNNKERKNIPPISPKGDVCAENPSDEDKFDIFRKAYKGTKRGLKTEFENFKKKHKDWREVLEILLPNYLRQCEIKEAGRKNGSFVPQEKNLSTYINQRCWEEEVSIAPRDNRTGAADWTTEEGRQRQVQSFNQIQQAWEM